MTNDDIKSRVSKSLEKYLQKQLPKKPRSKNKSPEKQVVIDCANYLEARGCFVNRIEAKAVYSFQAGRYLNSQANIGTPDIVAISPQGVYIAVECKAPGRLSTLRPAQRQHLVQALDRNAFAVVVDGSGRLQELFESFFDKNLGVAYLKDKLPSDKESHENNDSLFEE
jgi:hypothetical protein